MTTVSDVTTYLKHRQELSTLDNNKMIGNDIVLDDREKKVNSLLMELKGSEFDTSLRTLKFPPALHFFKAKELIDQSEVYKFIQMMPKGAVLHCHDTSMCSIKYVIETLTYWDGLYVKLDKTLLPVQFKFSESTLGEEWVMVSHLRKEMGDAEVDKMFQDALTLVVSDPKKSYPDINVVWSRFEESLFLLGGIVGYDKAFRQYHYEALKEFMKDHVMYTEFRGVLPPVYDIKGNFYEKIDIVRLYEEETDRFKTDYPDFFGAKFIYTGIRMFPPPVIQEAIEDALMFQKTFPNFFAGFDLVAQEDVGHPLIYYIDILVDLKEKHPELKCFYHAGETAWYGTAVDNNLLDAILLGAVRIGHGYALTKHPKLMEEIKVRNIAIEVCPLSNQVLKLVDDLRNHPAVTLFSQDFPLVVSNDDPGAWGAKGLSYDFYAAFMALGGRSADLRFLKKLALNSLRYNVLTTDERKVAEDMFAKQWSAFLDSVLQEFSMLEK